MKPIFLLIACLTLLSPGIFAQDMSYSKPGKDYYSELPNPAKTPVEEWSKERDDINVSFASDNIRYPKERVPDASSKTWNADFLAW